jgi:hypothetical protein
MSSVGSLSASDVDGSTDFDDEMETAVDFVAVGSPQHDSCDSSSSPSPSSASSTSSVTTPAPPAPTFVFVTTADSREGLSKPGSLKTSTVVVSSTSLAARPMPQAPVVRAESTTDEIRYKCDLCDQRFGLLAFLKHVKAFHKDDFPYVCPSDSCKKKFKTQSEFRAHRRLAHKPTLLPPRFPGSSSVTASASVAVVTVAGAGANAGAAQRPAVVLQQRPGQQQPQLQCSVCSLRFSSAADLSKHSAQHQPPKKGYFTCSQCETTHLTWEDFSQHFVHKHGAVPRIVLKYKCAACDLSFPSRADYLSHNAAKHNGGGFNLVAELPHGAVGAVATIPDVDSSAVAEDTAKPANKQASSGTGHINCTLCETKLKS